MNKLSKFINSGLLRSSLIFTSSNILSSAIPFLLLPILTRKLTPDEYSVIIAFTLWATVLGSVAGLSLHNAVVMQWSKTYDNDVCIYTGNAIILVIFSTLFISMVFAGIATCIDIGLTTKIAALTPIVAGCNVIVGIRFGILQIKKLSLAAAAIQIATALLNSGLSLIFVLVFNWGGNGRIFGVVLSTLIVSIISIYSLRYRAEAIFKYSIPDIKKLLQYGLPLFPHAFAGAVIAGADRFAVASFLGKDALGIYGVAVQLGMILTILADALVKAYTPTLYAMFNHKSTRAMLKVVGLAYLSIPFWLFIGMLLWLILYIAGPFILGHRFQEAINLSAWILGGSVTGAVYLQIAGIVFFSGHTKWIALASMSSAGFAVFFALILTKMFGISGAGLSYLTTQLIMLSIMFYFSTKVMTMPWNKPKLAIAVLLRK